MSSKLCYGLYTKPSKKKLKTDLSLDFVFPLELVAHWRKCSLVANFLANYNVLAFKKQKEAQIVLSTIINELIENAIKFNADHNKLVSISIQQSKTAITVETINSAELKNVQKIKRFVEKLNAHTYEELFIQALEKSVISKTEQSGLGLIGILKDYGAELGIKAEPSTQKGLCNILVKAEIPLKELNAL